jgi:hypothetical protein
MAQAAGKVSGATEPLEQERILIRVVQVEDRKHKTLRLAFYGAANGVSIAVLAIPSGFGDKDQRLKAGNQYVQQMAAQKFEVTATPLRASPSTATPQAPIRNSQGQYVGQFGRSEVDLTYHAKGIPPKDRDVPLQGVYVFVGMAFGATYGGVGTPMTWGQHAAAIAFVIRQWCCRKSRSSRRKSCRQISSGRFRKPGCCESYSCQRRAFRSLDRRCECGTYSMEHRRTHRVGEKRAESRG